MKTLKLTLLVLAMGCNAAYADKIPRLFCDIPAYSFKFKRSGEVYQKPSFTLDTGEYDWHVEPTRYSVDVAYLHHFVIDRATGTVTWTWIDDTSIATPTSSTSQCVRADEYKPKF